MDELECIEPFNRMTRSIATNLKILSDNDAAYLAGLIDGDGCLFIEKIKKKDHRGELTGSVSYIYWLW